MISEMMINKQLEKAKEGSLEYGVGMALIEICKANPKADELIAQDLVNEDMSIKKCGEKLYEYAKKNKSGNSFYMGPQIAKKLIKEFYGTPEVDRFKERFEGLQNEINRMTTLLGTIKEKEPETGEKLKAAMLRYADIFRQQVEGI